MGHEVPEAEIYIVEEHKTFNLRTHLYLEKKALFVGIIQLLKQVLFI